MTPHAFRNLKLDLMAFNYNNYGLLTGSPTGQRSLHHLLQSLFGTYDYFALVTKKVLRAYTHKNTVATPPFLIRKLQTIDFPSNLLLRVDRPLYGLPESGPHWFFNYSNLLKTRLSMTAAVYGPFLVSSSGSQSIKRHRTGLRGGTAFQTDDTPNLGNKSFWV